MPVRSRRRHGTSPDSHRRRPTLPSGRRHPPRMPDTGAVPFRGLSLSSPGIHWVDVPRPHVGRAQPVARALGKRWERRLPAGSWAKPTHGRFRGTSSPGPAGSRRSQHDRGRSMQFDEKIRRRFARLPIEAHQKAGRAGSRTTPPAAELSPTTDQARARSLPRRAPWSRSLRRRSSRRARRGRATSAR